MNKSKQNLINLLEMAYGHVKFKGKSCICPWHNDTKPCPYCASQPYANMVLADVGAKA